VNACTDLQKGGIKTSVRALHRELGGGGPYTTIFEYLQRLEKENQLALSMGVDISEWLRQMLLAEIGQAVSTATENLAQQLARAQAQLKEVQELLAKSEAQVDALKAEQQQAGGH
jgi:hypothetical protein